MLFGDRDIMEHIKPLAVVALVEDVPARNLRRGQVGTVVESVAPGVFEVEFCYNDGCTYASLALRADQLMQFAWLILIPITLVNILIIGMIYLIISSLGFGSLTNLVFLIVTGVINWVLLFGFIWLVRRATVASTRRAQAPALRARARVQAPLVQLPESVDLAGGGE